MNTITNNILVLVVGVVLALCVVALLQGSPKITDASVNFSNEYNATNTFAGDPDPIKVVKRGFGSLGSVVVTGANTGKTFLYNATTTNVNFRDAAKSTSTILIAEIPANATAGTYTFDVWFGDGLTVVSEGAEATSTITYR